MLPTARSDDDQVPPEGVEASDVVLAKQIELIPVMADGSGLIVSDVETRHPVGSVYVTVLVPTRMPVMMPEADPIDKLVLLLAHVPPEGDDVRVADDPMQIEDVPDIEDGKGLTVATPEELQPVGKI